MAENTDRELLELAAKAAGMKLADEVDSYIPGSRAMWVVGPGGRDAVWNPLNDDGDALRLALAIPACIVIDNDMGWCGVHLKGARGKYDLVEQFGNDKKAATRRAIVRAAAEIGKAMP